jgi:cell fate (sporulation/competence/biofilm development) regulator YmcA (YheA/YmcA/DUF963 family)
MIENSISELFNSIESSYEYQEYQKIKKILESDQEVLSLVDEIKKLQKESTALEYNNNPKYLELDKEIEQKVKKLNELPAYIKYLQAMDNFNQVLKTSSSLISNYVDDIIK